MTHANVLQASQSDLSLPERNGTIITPSQLREASDQRLRVLQVNYRHTFGGSERLAATIGSSLDPARFESLFAAMKGDGEVGDMLRSKGYSTVVFGRREGFDPFVFWRVLRYLRRVPIDIVQTHHVGSLVYCGPPAKMLGMKVVHTEHDVHSFRRLPNEMRWIKRLAWLPDRFIVIDPSIKDFLTQEIGVADQRISVIRNGIDLEKFHPPVPTERRPDAPFVLGWISRLAPPKRPDVLIEALAILAEEDPALRVRIIGGGELLEGLAPLARELGVIDRVELLGPREDVSDQLKQMDAYILVTEREGLPISLVEAMATEIPCVVSAVGGIPGLVKDGQNGFLLEDLDPRTLANAIRQLRAEPERAHQVAQAGRQSAKRRFDLSETIQEYMRVFEEVIDDTIDRRTEIPPPNVVPNRLKRVTFRTLCAVGTDHISRRRHLDRLVIVAYHAVAPMEWIGPRSWMVLPEQSFRDQVTYLKDHYKVIPISEAARLIAEKQPFTEPTACITFDDGYRNNRTVAYPILRELGLPATIYLATGFIGANRVHWTARLERAMITSREVRLNLLDMGLPDYPMRERVTQSYVRLVARLYRFPAKDREKILDVALRRLHGDLSGDFSCFEMMNWNEISELDATGLIEFGGHTINHQIVEPLDDEELNYEVGGSIEEVRRRVSNLSSTFAYPNGTPRDFDIRARTVLSDHGVKAAVSTIEGINSSGTDLFALQRISVGSQMSMDEFRLRVSGVVPTLKNLLQSGSS